MLARRGLTYSYKCSSGKRRKRTRQSIMLLFTNRSYRLSTIVSNIEIESLLIALLSSLSPC